MSQLSEREERVKWFQADRFGMFIHWGLYAIPAKGEWVRNAEEIKAEDYCPLMEEFSVKNYDPKKWAKLAKQAKQAGMKYAVLTAKHHDGFCLFDSKLTDFTSMYAPCKRDLVREFLNAFRAEGLKVGLYYSLLDWNHPDYPHYGDWHHPMRRNEEYKEKNHNFENYLKYMHGQVEELMTNYGKIDIIWFDFSYGEMRAEKWRAEELMKMVRKHQPHIICDNRLEGSGESSGSIKTANPTSYAGDFISPEQMIPPHNLVNELGMAVPWEACITLNLHWGYNSEDKRYKSAQMIIRTLVECVSKGGNLLVNIGPNALGEIPEESCKILEEVGNWMKVNGESIYHCGAADLEKPEWGRWTKNGKYLYAHIFEEQVGAICLKGLKNKIKRIRRLSDLSEIKESDYWNLMEYRENSFFHLYPSMTCSYPLPDEKDTVVRIELREI